MYEDPRDERTLLGLTAVAVLAAIAAALAWPAAPHDAQALAAEEAEFATPLPEAQWIATETPGEEMLVRRRSRAVEAAAARRAEEAELEALVRRSEDAVERTRRAAAKLEASSRALRPTLEDTLDTAPSGAGSAAPRPAH
jgi:hypothetical protein